MKKLALTFVLIGAFSIAGFSQSTNTRTTTLRKTKPDSLNLEELLFTATITTVHSQNSGKLVLDGETVQRAYGRVDNQTLVALDRVMVIALGLPNGDKIIKRVLGKKN